MTSQPNTPTPSRRGWSAGPAATEPWLRDLDFDPGIVVEPDGTWWFQGSFHRGRGALAPRWRRFSGAGPDAVSPLVDAHLDRTFADEAARLGRGFGGWWAGAIWPDSLGRWLTTVHAEYGYRRPRGPSYAHARSVYRAVSTDHGAHWELLDPILSSDPDRPGRRTNVDGFRRWGSEAGRGRASRFLLPLLPRRMDGDRSIRPWRDDDESRALSDGGRRRARHPDAAWCLA